MKVYLLKNRESILGIFSSKEKAEFILALLKKQYEEYVENDNYDYSNENNYFYCCYDYHCEEFELDCFEDDFSRTLFLNNDLQIKKLGE